ncbi:hypothetical protein ACOIFF_03390 [Klebsiella pneumoniae]|uniref:hypothetical protein n=1 Tax=Klebsiella pneumoniae TaxID=573 RepID=UPI000807FB62|nr:hypothetical protein [Klebsiella pneumoniae]MBZ1999398.1 hypothetical protein [Klebsiella pneumoniae]MCQ0735029.1 hypothetical protein [Klebsiella pneumoniae]MDD1879023.1 hypothetical protein [Klebsiella pneumoniae]MEB5562829.1 hypothetical protein [Klebsiella pneumoniae]MEC4502308.1 hypothetical protein [Klebsiella pneumoniae]
MKRLLLAVVLASVSAGALADDNYQCHSAAGDAVSVQINNVGVQIDGNWTEQSNYFPSKYDSSNGTTSKTYKSLVDGTYYILWFNSSDDLITAINLSPYMNSHDYGASIPGNWIGEHRGVCRDREAEAREANEAQAAREAKARAAQRAAEAKRLDAYYQKQEAEQRKEQAELQRQQEAAQAKAAAEVAAKEW